MKAFRTCKELAENIYSIAKSFAENQECICQSIESIERTLKEMLWYSRIYEKNKFYISISTNNGTIAMNSRDIFDKGIICTVSIYKKQVKIIYHTK